MPDFLKTVSFWRESLPHWEVVDGRYFVTYDEIGHWRMLAFTIMPERTCYLCYRYPSREPPVLAFAARGDARPPARTCYLSRMALKRRDFSLHNLNRYPNLNLS